VNCRALNFHVGDAPSSALATTQTGTQLEVAKGYMADLARRVLVSDPEESRRALGHAVVHAVHDQALDRDIRRIRHKKRRSEG
jgi:hypothetical protein